MRAIINQYADELTDYYQIYAAGLQRLFAEIDHMSAKEIHSSLQALSGGLGARIAKAGQRAKRTFIFDSLYKAKVKGADLTIHKVQSISIQLLGRRLDNKKVVKHFATPGRGSHLADRCQMTKEETEALVNTLIPFVDLLTEQLAQERVKAADQWQNSPQRAKIYQQLKRPHQQLKF